MTDKSKKQMKEEWLQALRSGKYAQVEGTLKGITEDGEAGYCCLGVFCSVVLGEEPEVCVFDEGGYIFEGPKETYSELTALFEGLEEDWMKMNDEGYTFESIADMIEKEWEV